MPNPEQTRHALLQGLVGDHLDLWHNSPHFHAAVHALADMLPLWIDGIADDARKKQAAHHDYLHRGLRAGMRLVHSSEDDLEALVEATKPRGDGDGG